jgi:hypothetical protein
MNGQDIVIIMGLFGSDKPTKRVQNIVDEANHPSVDSEVVGKKNSSGFIQNDYLSDKPLVEYLNSEEQPHYIFRLGSVGNLNVGVFVDNGEDLIPSSGLTTIVAVTDHRVLIVVGNKDGDRVVTIEYDAVSTLELDDVDDKHHSIYQLTIATDETNYRIRQLDSSVDDIQEKCRAAGQYIASRTE